MAQRGKHAFQRPSSQEKSHRISLLEVRDRARPKVEQDGSGSPNPHDNANMIHDLNIIPAKRRIDTHRVIPFTPLQVFRAFSDPAVLATWWGPSGFTNTFDEFNFSEGGIWRFTMHSPDGKDFQNESRFVKISEPSLVIIDHLCAPLFQAHFSFRESPGGCKLSWCMIFEDAQTCSNVAKFAGDANEQNIDRLVAAIGKGVA